MPLPGVAEAVAPFLTTLRSLPIWILVSLALAGFAVLFAPPFGGINPSSFRTNWGVWAWVEAITFSILAAARIIEAGITTYLSKRKAAKARHVLRFVPLYRHPSWHLAKQQDDSFVSQLSIEILASNTSNRPVQIVSVRLLRPRNTKLLHAVTTLQDDPVPPYSAVASQIHIMVRGKLAAQGSPVHVALGITDQYGEEYKVKNIRVVTHDKRSDRGGLIKRLGYLRAMWSFRPTDEKTPKMPWTYEPGAEYINMCEAILMEERRNYGANGRGCGGLGSLNIKLQSGPVSGGIRVGAVPQILCKPRGVIALSPNLDRFLKLHASLADPDKVNLEQYLLNQLQAKSPFATVAYFVFLALHRIGRTTDALKTARTFLKGDKVYGYSNVLGTLSTAVSCEHPDIELNLYSQILDVLEEDEEYDFGLREKINLAKLERFDRDGVVDSE